MMETPTTPRKPRLDILYMDNHLLVVNKPPGMLSQEDRTGDTSILSVGKEMIKQWYHKPGAVYLGLVHRLDRPASGVMVLARTSKAAARLSEAFSKRQIEKRYLAIVQGRVQGEGTCEDYLVKENERVRVVGSTYPKAQHAILHWKALATDGNLSLLDIRLDTGRPHQIRVQLAHRDWPILGDIRYGATQPLDGKNIALHAYRLALTHPVKREEMVWQAAPPQTWPAFFEENVRDAMQQQAKSTE